MRNCFQENLDKLVSWFPGCKVPLICWSENFDTGKKKSAYIVLLHKLNTFLNMECMKCLLYYNSNVILSLYECGVSLRVIFADSGRNT